MTFVPAPVPSPDSPTWVDNMQDAVIDLERARATAVALEQELARVDRLARNIVTSIKALHQEGAVNIATWPHAQALIAWSEEEPWRP